VPGGPSPVLELDHIPIERPALEQVAVILEDHRLEVGGGRPRGGLQGRGCLGKVRDHRDRGKGGSGSVVGRRHHPSNARPIGRGFPDWPHAGPCLQSSEPVSGAPRYPLPALGTRPSGPIHRESAPDHLSHIFQDDIRKIRPALPPPVPELRDVPVELPTLAQVAVVLPDHRPELLLGQGRLHRVDP